MEPDAKLLEILVCPITKQTLFYDRGRRELVSRNAGLAFPIRNGVPIMIEAEARKLDESVSNKTASAALPPAGAKDNFSNI